MIQTLEKDFKSVINEIKNDIKDTQIRAVQQVNSELILLYFRIGKHLNDNYKYGNKFIDELSKELKIEFPNFKGFSIRNLKYMKSFYLEYKDDEVVQQLVAQLPWGHNLLLIQRIKDINTRILYINATIANGWSRSILDTQIESKFHQRLGKSYNNFNLSLPKLDSDLANNTLKDPYIFDFITLKKNYKEVELEKAMLEKIKNVLLELGKGFTFVGSQYKISTEHNDYYIDLLFYHLQLRCYVVGELKVTEFKPEYIGQLGFYVKAIDKTLKTDLDNPTIGLLLCKNKDKLSVEWSLESTNVPIGVSSFEIGKYIPKDILEKLPTEEDINLHINI